MAAAQIEPSLVRQHAVRFGNRVVVHSEIDREASHRGKRLADGKHALHQQRADGIGDLPVHGHGGREIDADGGLGSHCLLSTDNRQRRSGCQPPEALPRKAAAVVTNGAAWSPKIGACPPFGTTQSAAPGIARYSSNRELHRVQRIANAVDDKRPRRNQGPGGRIEVHVLVIVGEFAGVLVEARPRGMDAASHLAMELRNKEGR